MKNIAVFFGGETVEHDISIITGVLMLNTIDKNKFSPIPVYVDNDGSWYTGEMLFDLDFYKNKDLSRLKKVTLISGDNKLYIIKKSKNKPLLSIAVAINCMHGERGEDGSLSGYLNMCKIPLASPSMLSSAISIDKAFTKVVLKALSIKTVPYAVVENELEHQKIINKLGLPLIIKPNTSGSSIGIKKADTKEEFLSAVNEAKRFSECVIAEKYLEEKIEINCSAYKNKIGEIKVSECERPYSDGNVLSFEDKYLFGKREFPANIEKCFSDKIKETTKKIYEKLNFFGIIRIDFFIYKGEIYVNEINSVPGSLAYYLFTDTLKDFSDILTDMIEFAERQFVKALTEQRKISTSILSVGGGKSSKRL